MDRFPTKPGSLGIDGGARPADLLRRKAMGMSPCVASPPLAPPASGGLGTLGEEDEGGSPHVPPAAGCVPVGAFATPKPRAPIALANWQTYWDKKLEVHLPSRNGTFNVYVAGESGPVVMCVHGGGYTGLTWSLVAKRLKDKYRIVAPDMRGHGLTTTDNDTDFCKQTMSEDIIAIWEDMFGGAGAGAGGEAAKATSGLGAASSGGGEHAGAAKGSADGASDGPPASILVGHSMGGGLAVWAGAAKRIKRLEGVVVIDVVEGTALAALPHMMNVLAGRPASFASPEEAITWATRSGMSRNKEAAAISMPSQLTQKPGDGAAGREAVAVAGHWTWRTPLELSRPYWEGWYSGLSEAFLQLSCPKALLLAGTDRLDKALTIGQMQGKFQLILMPTAGHAIHEDEPDRAAEHLLGFLRRFRVGEPPLQFPRPPPGTRPVLPIVAGPVISGPAPAGSASAGQQ